jgi:hypothetical protein
MPNDLYEKSVKNILEKAINRLIDDFICNPYKHRCEHSIHCELYNMLSAEEALQGLHPFKDDENHEWKTGLIHKEWPELERRDGHRRRGNSDLTILDPNDILKRKRTEFTEGRIPPKFVVELGLNYNLDHLKLDDEKLNNSKIEYGYLVHLWQPHRTILGNEVKDQKNWCKGRKYVALGVFKERTILVKHLEDKEVKEKYPK